MKYIILADGSIIEATSVSFEPTFTVRVTKEKFLDIWDRLTEENLSSIQINDSGVIVARFKDCQLVGTQTSGYSSEYLTGHFYLMGTPAKAVSEEYEDAFKVLTGEIE